MNLEAKEALRIITAIITGGLSELDNIANGIVEAAEEAGRAIKSEDSDLGNVVTSVGQTYKVSLNEQIKNVLNKLLKDFEEYEMATVTEEEETKAKAAETGSKLADLAARVAAIMGQN